MAINKLQSKLRDPNLDPQQRARIQTRIGYEQRHQGNLQSGSPTQRPTPMQRGGMGAQPMQPQRPMQPQGPQPIGQAAQPMQPQGPQFTRPSINPNFQQQPNPWMGQMPNAFGDTFGAGANMANRFAGSYNPYSQQMQNLMAQKAPYQQQMPMDNMQALPYQPQNQMYRGPVQTQGQQMPYQAQVLRGGNGGLL